MDDGTVTNNGIDRRTPAPPTLDFLERGRRMGQLLRCFARDPAFQTGMASLYRKHEGIFKKSQIHSEMRAIKERQTSRRVEPVSHLSLLPATSSFVQLAIRFMDNRRVAQQRQPNEGDLACATDTDKADRYISDVVTYAARWQLGRLVFRWEPITDFTLEDDHRLPEWLRDTVSRRGLDPSLFTPTANWRTPTLDRYVGIECIHDWFLDVSQSTLDVRSHLNESVHDRFGREIPFGGSAPAAAVLDDIGKVEIELSARWRFLGEPWTALEDRLTAEFQQLLRSEKTRITGDLESHGYVLSDTAHRLDDHILWTYRRLQGQRPVDVARDVCVDRTTVSKATNRIAALLDFKFPA